MTRAKKANPEVPVDRLVQEARRAMKRAYNPYSGFAVGAAIATAEGVIVTGCNVENASYGHTICAERTAAVKAVSEGHRRFQRIAIVSSSSEPVAPCGACRQFLYEFAPDLEIVMAGRRTRRTVKLGEILPLAFGPSDLGR